MKTESEFDTNSCLIMEESIMNIIRGKGYSEVMTALQCCMAETQLNMVRTQRQENNENDLIYALENTKEIVIQMLTKTFRINYEGKIGEFKEIFAKGEME